MEITYVSNVVQEMDVKLVNIGFEFKTSIKNINNFYSHFDAIQIILNKLKTIE